MPEETGGHHPGGGGGPGSRPAVPGLECHNIEINNPMFGEVDLDDDEEEETDEDSHSHRLPAGLPTILSHAGIGISVSSGASHVPRGTNFANPVYGFDAPIGSSRDEEKRNLLTSLSQGSESAHDLFLDGSGGSAEGEPRTPTHPDHHESHPLA